MYVFDKMGITDISFKIQVTFLSNEVIEITKYHLSSKSSLVGFFCFLRHSCTESLGMVFQPYSLSIYRKSVRPLSKEGTCQTGEKPVGQSRNQQIIEDSLNVLPYSEPR